MKEYVRGRNVVIVNQKGEGNIEQAIFILRKNIKEPESDYILDEAKNIVNEFVARNKMEIKGNTSVKWLLAAVVAISTLIAMCVYIAFM